MFVPQSVPLGGSVGPWRGGGQSSTLADVIAGDSATYYSVVATILVGLLVAATVQYRDVSPAMRDGTANLGDRVVFLS